MSAEITPPTVYSDGLIKTPSQRWLGPLDAMCRFRIMPGIDIAEADALFSDEQINANWEELRRLRQDDPEGITEYDVFSFAHNNFRFPDRQPRAHGVLPGETITEHSMRVIQAAFRTATLETTSQIGTVHGGYESGGRFSDGREKRASRYGWDPLPVCKAAVRTLGTWGLKSVVESLEMKKELVSKTGGTDPNVDKSWGAFRDQLPVALRIRFDYVMHLHPMPDIATDQEIHAVERIRAETLIEDVEFYENYYMHWREGADDITKLDMEPGSSYKRVSRLPNGGFVYNDYDADTGPRDEMREDDLDLLRQWATDNGGKAPSQESAMKLFASLRRSAASGEDFRAVDQKDPSKFYTLHTIDLASIKLNAVQYENAQKLAWIYRQKAVIASENGKLMEEIEALDKAAFFEKDTQDLSDNIHEYFLTDNGFCADYDVVAQKTQPGNALAGIFALGAGVFSQEDGSRMLDKVEELFGRAGGLVNTLAEDSPQQWDNNCWAIMQMEAVDAAILYKRHDLALVWTRRWLHSNDLMFEKYQALYEKSSPNAPGEPGGGGEYDCVKNLLMSLAVDLILREKLDWFQKKSIGQLPVKYGTTELSTKVMQAFDDTAQYIKVPAFAA